MRFAALLASAVRPALSVASPSLLSVQPCSLAATGRVAQAADARNGVATRFGAGCSFVGASGTVELVTGALRQGATVPGSARTVDGHRLYLQADDAPRCAIVSPEGRTATGREVITARFTGSGDSAPADCGVAADALTRYLDALDALESG